MFPADLPRPRQRSPYHVIERGVKRAERKTLSPGPEPAARPASSPSGLNPADARTPCDAAVMVPGCRCGCSLPGRRSFCGSHTVTDRSSIIHCVEDHWLEEQCIGNGSFDTIASSISVRCPKFNHLRLDGYLFPDPNTGEKVFPSVAKQ